MPKEPDTADPEDVARKVAAAPTLKIPPPPEWVYNDEGRVIDILQEGMTFRRKLFNYLAELGYNLVFGHLPSQRARQGGFLRRCGADIGKRTKIGRNTKVLNIEFLTIGDDTVIGHGACSTPGGAGCGSGTTWRSPTTCTCSAADTTSTIRTSCRCRSPPPSSRTTCGSATGR